MVMTVTVNFTLQGTSNVRLTIAREGPIFVRRPRECGSSGEV